MEYPLGQPVTIGPITVQQRNTDGTYTLVDASTITTVVYLAAVDGTWTTTGTYASPTHISLGKYQQDVPTADLTVLGHYQYVVTTTGTGAGVTVGEFDVYDPKRTAVISLQDAKDMLNIPQATTTSDTEIASYVATIESSLRSMTGGPVVNKTITSERVEFTGWYEMLQVRQRPLVSVTSVTSVQTGTVYDISAGLDINPAARTIRRKDGSPFPADCPVALVTYVAGWGTAVPPSFNLAARIILAWLWETQHGPAARPSMGGVELMATVPGFPYAVPNGAAELLKGHQNGLAFMDQVFAW
jgi:hypothetical protein